MWEGLFRVGAGGQRTPLSDRLRNSEYNNWIVFRQFRAAVVCELEAEADHV